MRALPFALVVSASLLGSGASGAAIVSFPELPQFEMTRAPHDPPAFVSAAAHAEGLFVARAPLQQSPRFKVFQLFDSKSAAAAFSRKGRMAVDSGEAPRACAFVAADATAFGEPWTPVATDTFTHFSGGQQAPVVGLHVETPEGNWTEQGGTLGIVNGWLDLRSGGLKVTERSRMPAQHVTDGPFGVRVFAARGTDAVHFIVLPPPPAKGSPNIGSSFTQAVIQTGGEVGTTECQHARVTLEATRGTGAQATVSFRHLNPLPPEPEGDQDAPAALSTFQILRVHLSASRNDGRGAPVVSVRFNVDAPQILE